MKAEEPLGSKGGIESPRRMLSKEADGGKKRTLVLWKLWNTGTHRGALVGGSKNTGGGAKESWLWNPATEVVKWPSSKWKTRDVLHVKISVGKTLIAKLCLT